MNCKLAMTLYNLFTIKLTTLFTVIAIALGGCVMLNRLLASINCQNDVCVPLSVLLSVKYIHTAKCRPRYPINC